MEKTKRYQKVLRRRREAGGIEFILFFKQRKKKSQSSLLHAFMTPLTFHVLRTPAFLDERWNETHVSFTCCRDH